MIRSRRPVIWVPTDDGTMVRIDTDAPRYVREAYFLEATKQLEDELEIAKRNEADARHSAAEVSQREARWMMIEQRLRTTIAAQCGGDINAGVICSCVKCVMARELLAILNSDPPVGVGFRSIGQNVDPYAPVLERMVLNEAKIQGNQLQVFPCIQNLKVL